jgi:hypothetical protein
MTHGRIRWKLAGTIIVPSFAISAGLLIAVAHGVLAVSFLVSNQEFKVSADRVEAAGIIQYGTVDRRYDGKLVPVTVQGVKKSTSYGLCQSTVARNVPILGTFTVKVTTDKVVARDSYADIIQSNTATVISKNANNGIAVGVSEKGPGVQQGDKVDLGSFAQEADSVVVINSRQIVLASSATYTNVSGSSLRFYKGVRECF